MLYRVDLGKGKVGTREEGGEGEVWRILQRR